MRPSSCVPLLSVALLCSCVTQTPERRRVVALVDYSGSVARDQLERCAGTLAQDVVASFGVHDALTVYPIDAAAVTRNERLLDFDLASHEPPFSRPEDGVTHKEDSLRMRLTTFVRSVQDSLARAIVNGSTQRKQFSGRTDIIGALQGVASGLEHNEVGTSFMAAFGGVLRRSAPRVKNIVVICSDMINESPDADFQHGILSDSGIDSLLVRLGAAGKLPDLREASVFVTGRTGRDAAQVERIRAFWTKFFRATGADLRAYDFDTSTQLKLFLQRS